MGGPVLYKKISSCSEASLAILLLHILFFATASQCPLCVISPRVAIFFLLSLDLPWLARTSESPLRCRNSLIKDVTYSNEALEWFGVLSQPMSMPLALLMLLMLQCYQTWMAHHVSALQHNETGVGKTKVRPFLSSTSMLSPRHTLQLYMPNRFNSQALFISSEVPHERKYPAHERKHLALEREGPWHSSTSNFSLILQKLKKTATLKP